MAISFELNAEPRSDTGKGASRRLRYTGKVPAIMYGGKKDPESLTLDHNEIIRNLEHEAFYSHILTVKVGSDETQAVMRDLQRHPSKPFILHMDLQRVSATETLKMLVPVHILGEEEAVGIKAGGIVSHDSTEVLVECLHKDLPEYIEVDITALDIGDSLHLTDLTLSEGVSLVELARGEGHDQSVVSIHVKRVVEEEPEEVEAEGEEAAAEGDEAKPEGDADGEKSD